MFYWRWFNRPRHPLARLLFGVIGLVLLVGVLALGFFALATFAVVGTAFALVRAFGRATAASPVRAADPRVIEGEFVVLRSRAASVER